MNDSNMIWWIVGGLILLALIVFVTIRASAGKHAEAQREEAAAIRDDARDEERRVRERQARADLTDAEHRKAQAEADEAAARAEQIRVEHERNEDAYVEARDAHAAKMREADALDPEVRTDKEGFRVDEAGHRIEDESFGRGGAFAAGRRHDADLDNDVVGGRAVTASADRDLNSDGDFRDRDHDGRRD